MDEGERLGRLIEEVLARLDSGEDAALDAACREHPELAADLRRRIAALGELGLARAAGAVRRPEKVGDFTLLERIGAGGMGVVYRARQEALGRSVALKLIRPDILHQPRARARFARETAIVARLQHPGIVPIYTVGEDPELPWYAMEHVPGCTLAEALEELADRDPAELDGADLLAAVRACSPANAELGADADNRAAPALFEGSWEAVCLRVARLVAEALEHAHGRGVLHRDVKPSNVLITPGGRVLLHDFGLSRTHGADHVTRAGDRVGSLPYMAPELLRDGADEPDKRSDVYALGVTLYQLLTLRLPFAAADAALTLAAILAGRPNRPRAYHRGLSWEAETVCLAALERDRRRRYATAADFAHDLENALERRPVEARRAGPLLRLRRLCEQHPGAAAALVLAVLLPTVAALLLAREARRVGSALEAVETEKARAEAGFATALDAVDRMLTRVGDEELADVPGAQTVRRELLRDALAFYERFVADRGDDPELGERVAGALVHLARIHGLLAENEQAVALQRRALERYGELLAAAAGDARDDLAWELARGHGDLGTYHRALGADSEAEAEFRAAIAAFEELTARRPDHGSYLLTFGTLLDRFSVFQGERKRPEAEELAQRAIRTLAPLAERGSPAGARGALGAALNNEAVLHLRAGRLPEAEALLARSVALRGALADEGLATRQDRVGLALATMNLGILQARSESAGGSDEGTLRGLLAITDALVADFPSVPEHRDLGARARINLANVLDDRGGGAEVEELYAAAMRESRAAIAMSPSSALYRETLALAYQNLFWHLRRLGRHADIAARVDEVPAIEPDRPVPHRRIAATALAYCAEIVMRDATLGPARREELREAYVQRMIGAFREMMRLGWSDAGHLDREWFADVREHPDVVRLAAELTD